MEPGADDITRAAEALAARIPDPLVDLAHIAYNYAWSWTPGGDDVFRTVDPLRWETGGGNPVRLLSECTATTLERAAQNDDLLARARGLRERIETHTNADAAIDPGSRVAFFCTEFAIHGSLPIYSGGLGVLAGDILKEASDRRLPYVGVGLLYRQGYFHQRVDTSGWQHEYWTEEDPEHLPAARVTNPDGRAMTVTTSIRGRDVVTQIWRVNVGRVPMYLLDAQRPENSSVDRWITSRLYVGDRRFRLAQYALLGLGGMRALRALGIDPAVIHMNEGHAALAPLEIVAEHVANGASFGEGLERARARTIFTTHTPIAAGNEAYTAAELLDVLGDTPSRVGADAKEVLALGRSHGEDDNEPFGMTPLGLRVSRAANGVSKLHGRVAREMWQHLYPDRTVDRVPIGHVTNGVHVPTWIAPAMRDLLDRHLPADWLERQADPAVWQAIDDIPDEELWAVRNELRADLVAFARERAAHDRLSRGEPIEYVESAMRAFDPDVLTLGFARRAVGYKRLYLLTLDPGRALRLLEGDRSVQLLLAGKPHPMDEEGKRIVQGVFELKWAPHVSERVAFLEDYDLRIGARLVAGCDVWINVPRPPLEASGTSGMKVALNGGLNLSVLDGWWDEGFDGTNGWAITSHPNPDHHAQDAADAAALYDLLENEVIPAFYDRDEQGIPRAWVRRIKSSLRSIAPEFSASRMVGDYVRALYDLG